MATNYGLKNWRNASTLMILSRIRHRKINSTFPAEDYKVLLLKRSSKSSFMPNLCVFPGGTISKADFSPRWLDLFRDHGVPENVVNSIAGVSRPAPQLYQVASQPGSLLPEIAFRLCALRETFEESGLLITRPVISNSSERSPITSIKIFEGASQLDKWRRNVIEDPSMFMEMCRELKCMPDIWALFEWSNWLTPEFEKKRFDTMFYICLLDNEADITEDGMEIVHSTWMSPSEALDCHLSRSIRLAPPQTYELCRLTRDPSYSDLAKFVAQRETLGNIRMKPIRNDTDRDGVSQALLPGDELYIDDEEPSGQGESSPTISGRLNRFEYSAEGATVTNNFSLCGHRTIDFSRDYVVDSKL